MSMKKRQRQRQGLCNTTINSTSPALDMRKISPTISKATKPRIRIIHIFAPEIINTDVANFRELVQRLTGKHAETCSKDKPERIDGREDEMNRTREKMDNKDEQIMWQWQGENPIGYLEGFSEVDGFVQEFGEYPLFPFDSSHMYTSFLRNSYIE